MVYSNPSICFLCCGLTRGSWGATFSIRSRLYDNISLISRGIKEFDNFESIISSYMCLPMYYGRYLQIKCLVLEFFLSGGLENYQKLFLSDFLAKGEEN